MVLLTSIGKAAVTASFVFVGTHTTEVFPTVVRNSGYATGSFFARVGGIVAPQMALLVSINRCYIIAFRATFHQHLTF